MSRKEKGRESRASRRRRKRGLPDPARRKRARAYWIAGGAIAAALVLWAAGGRISGGETITHPEPRADASADHVVPADRYAPYPRVAEVYRAAEVVAPVLDGLYCYCHCSGHAGHRSLLTCFESDHGAACDVCLSEASVAYRMTLDGHDLEAIRREVDDLFG